MKAAESSKDGVKEVWEGFLTDYWDASVSMECEKAKRSWCVRIVTSMTGRLPPTPSMQSLHKLRPVFPPHMASIGGYCCCCCVCSSKKITARHSSTNLIMKSVVGKQIELAVSLSVGYFCGVRWIGSGDCCIVFSWLLEKSFSICAQAWCVCLLCVYVCAWTGLGLKSRSSANKSKLFTTWLVVKSKYASVEAYQRLLHLVPG